jgi:uncharacterized protein YjdB
MKRTRHILKCFLSLMIILGITVGMSALVLANETEQQAWSSEVSPTVASSISLVSAVGVYGSRTVFTATLMAGTTPLVNKPVYFSLNGRRLGVAWTNASGVAVLQRSLERVTAGTYADAVKAFFKGDDIYISSMGTGALTLAKQDVVVTARNKSRLVGTENPPLTYCIKGKVLKGMIEGITLATTATASSPVGTYEITITGPAFTDNYNITYVSGILSVVSTMDIKAIQINGPDTLTIPTVDADSRCQFEENGRIHAINPKKEGQHIAATYKAIAIDQNDVVLSRVPATWSLLAPVTGVSVNAKKGIVIITDKAAAGSFTLIATYSGTIMASKTVTLVAPVPVAVQSIVLKKTAITIFVGKSIRLTTKILPHKATNKAVTWTSSDSALAAVDANGKVTGVSAGTAVITVTTVDGAFSAQCTVTVEAAAAMHEGHKSYLGFGSRYNSSTFGRH